MALEGCRVSLDVGQIEGWTPEGNSRLINCMIRNVLRKKAGIVSLVGLLGMAVLSPAAWSAVDVRPERVPEGGLQPDALVDAQGRVRLIYLSGDPKAADIHCVSRESGRGAGRREWSRPQTVNSEAGAAVAIGSVRGARLALGGSGILHVVWNGSSKVPATAAGSAPLLYSRSKPSGEGFEPQRALGGTTRHLDGGASVAADGKGTVGVVWHAALPTAPAGGDDETHRAVFLSVSRDEGRTFDAPRRIDPPGMGVCACCGLDAGVGPDGSVWVLVRGAAGKSQRGMQLLTAGAGSLDFQRRTLDSWDLNQCPMSTARLSGFGGRSLAVWMSEGRIRLGRMGVTDSVRALSESGRKANHPVVVPLEGSGSLVVAWTEGTAWQRGGDLAWRTVGADASQDSPVQRLPGVPVWGSVAAWREADGHVTIVY